VTQDRWLSVEEIAEHLGVSKESIYRWFERGRIPAHRVGKQWRFQTEEANEWVRHGEASGEATIRKQENAKGSKGKKETTAFGFEGRLRFATDKLKAEEICKEWA